MTDHRYTPLEVQMLLDVHTKGYAFPASAPGSPPTPPSSSHVSALEKLKAEGMISPASAFASHELTPKGAAWLEAVLTLPLPVESWRIPDRTVAVTLELDNSELERKILQIAEGVVAAGMDPRRNR